MNVRRLLLALGTVAFAGGIAIVVGAIDVELTQPTILVVGLLALGIGLSALFRRGGAGSRATTPDPERRTTVPVPGDSFTETLDAHRRGHTGHRVSGSVTGLRSAAVAALTRFEGDTKAEAVQRLEDGTWTDDPAAAAFLSESIEPPSPSLRDRVAAISGRETGFRSGVRHAVAEIAAIGDHEPARDERSLPRHVWSDHGDTDSRRTRTTTTAIDGIEAVRNRPTDYWYGIGAIALLSVGIGAVTESPAVVLAGVVGVGYAGFARAFKPPELDLSIHREPSESEPAPGDEIDIVVTITNERDVFVPDLRFVDGVPAGMAVVDGSSRLGTALRPGESATFEYTVAVGRGTHEFDPALAVVRDLSRSTEREYLIGSETTVVCEPELHPIAAPVPLRPVAASFSGRLQTADGGSGTTFHSVREYRRGDPLSRVDWNRHAKTGELATLEFHEERAARVVVMVDARAAAYVAPSPEASHAVDRSVAAAGRIAATLLANGDTVGLAAIGPTGGRDGRNEADPEPDPCWLAPGSGRHHEGRLATLLATHPQFATTAPDDGGSRWRWQLRSLRRRLSSDTQIVLLTPLCDYAAADIARRLDAREHAVTVISPDPTATDTAGNRLARLNRRIRQFDLRRAGIPVVDWPDGDSIDDVLARQSAGGRR